MQTYDARRNFDLGNTEDRQQVDQKCNHFIIEMQVINYCTNKTTHYLAYEYVKFCIKNSSNQPIALKLVGAC